MPFPFAAIPAVAQAGMGIYKAIEGGKQKREAQETIRRLQEERPELQLPPALLDYAREPIAEEYMEAQEEGAQRRTSQAIKALGKGGSRTLAALPGILQQEQQGEQKRMGNYAQQERQAQLTLGEAQDRLNKSKVRQYRQDITAARQSADIGRENIFEGVGDVLGGVSYGAGALGGASSSATGLDSPTTPVDVSRKSMPQVNIPQSQMSKRTRQMMPSNQDYYTPPLEDVIPRMPNILDPIQSGFVNKRYK